MLHSIYATQHPSPADVRLLSVAAHSAPEQHAARAIALCVIGDRGWCIRCFLEIFFEECCSHLQKLKLPIIARHALDNAGREPQHVCWQSVLECVRHTSES